MSETLQVAQTNDREEKYKLLIPQIKSLVENEPDPVANMANIAAAIKETFGFLWVGFYVVKGDELVLGPFQGPIACTRIAFGKGVCGTSWQKKETIIVANVDTFPGHIACSPLSKSEIVLPVLKGSEVAAVLDIDSAELHDFHHVDHQYLEQITALLEASL